MSFSGLGLQDKTLIKIQEVITKARVVAPDTDDEDVPPKNTKGKGKEKQKLPKAKWVCLISAL